MLAPVLAPGLAFAFGLVDGNMDDVGSGARVWVRTRVFGLTFGFTLPGACAYMRPFERHSTYTRKIVQYMNKIKFKHRRC